MVSEREEQDDVAAKQREPGAARLDELGRARRDEDHEDDRGQDRRSGLEASSSRARSAGTAGSTKAAPISEPKTMIPAHAATQNVRREATSRSYSGIRRPPLAEENATSAATAIAASTSVQRPLVRHGREVDREDQRADEDEREDAAEVVHRLGRLVDVARDEASTAMTRATAASGRVTRKTEPHQKCSSSAPATSGPSAATPPPIADQRAIDFVRPGPDQSAVISASVVG